MTEYLEGVASILRREGLTYAIRRPGEEFYVEDMVRYLRRAEAELEGRRSSEPSVATRVLRRMGGRAPTLEQVRFALALLRGGD